MMKVNDVILANHSSEFCNHSSTYPPTHPTIFSTLYYGALKLANPYQIFPFFYKDILTKSNLITFKGSDYSVELLLFTLPIYLSTKIKLLGQIFILYI